MIDKLKELELLNYVLKTTNNRDIYLKVLARSQEIQDEINTFEIALNQMYSSEE